MSLYWPSVGTAVTRSPIATCAICCVNGVSMLMPPLSIVGSLNRWVVKFGPLIDKRVRAIRNSRSMGWHVDETYIRVKGSNNLIESDHAALKRIINPAKGFQSLRTAKSTIQAIEAFRTIKRGDLREQPANAAAEVRLMNTLLNIAA